MEITQNSMLKEQPKRPKSATRFPKISDNYVVDLTIQETLDVDITQLTASQQNKLDDNSAGSESISSHNSTAFADNISIQSIPSLADTHVTSPIGDVKIDILEGSSNETENIRIDDYLDYESGNKQPKVIFNASMNTKRYKSRHLYSRKRRSSNMFVLHKDIIKINNNEKMNITKTVKNYYGKVKINSLKSKRMKQMYSTTISRVVSRSRILKKVSARSNLHGNTGLKAMPSDELSYNENDDGSIYSTTSTSTAKRSSSHASQTTLVNMSLNSLRSDNFSTLKPVDSVTRDALNTSPFKKDIINVAVAVAFNPLKPSSIEKEPIFSSDEIVYDGTTSIDTVSLLDTKTYSPPSSENCLNDKLSNINLKLYPKDYSDDVSKNDTFIMDQTSSEFNKSSFSSEFGTASISDLIIRDNSNKPQDNTFCIQELPQCDISTNNALLDTVINLGFYQEMPPSGSSKGNLDNDFSDITMTDSLPFSKNKEEEKLSEIPKIILKKPFGIQNDINQHNIHSLRNEVTVEAALTNASPQKTIFANEVDFSCLPFKLESWERLTLVIELAMKRLEDALADRIVKELKKSLSSLKIQREEKRKKDIETNTLVKDVENNLTERDCGLQCDLVRNQVIDQLMLQLRVEEPGPLVDPQTSLKTLKAPQIVQDYFKILNPASVDDVEMEKGDATRISATSGQSQREQIYRFQRLKVFFSSHFLFLRENLLVIASVPTFFITLFCLYGVIMLLTKPW